jgi:uncharacterized membrane protein
MKSVMFFVVTKVVSGLITLHIKQFFNYYPSFLSFSISAVGISGHIIDSGNNTIELLN